MTLVVEVWGFGECNISYWVPEEYCCGYMYSMCRFEGAQM